MRINEIHQPVLFDEVLAMLAPKEGESYLDLTAGYGGHATGVIEHTKAVAEAVLVDRDSEAQRALAPFSDNGAKLLHTDFLSASQELAEQGARFDMILADLGVSSLHLDKGERGFSFTHDGPLDMRMDDRLTLAADTVVNTWSARELTDIFQRYGEVRGASKIAQAIIHARPHRSTAELAEVVKHASPAKYGRIHPATTVFQAIRIAVNDEIGQLRTALPIWLELLTPGGRLAVISFHSLEDRLVKQAFADVATNTLDAEFASLAKKPITASAKELDINPRSRSAKLRGVVKK